MSHTKHMYHLESEKQFWEITINGTQTAIRAGKLGSKGRQYPSKKHETVDFAQQFVTKNVKAKKILGFRDLSAVNSPKKFIPPPPKETTTWRQPPKKRLSVRKTLSVKDKATKLSNQNKKIRGPLKKSQTVRLLYKDSDKPVLKQTLSKRVNSSTLRKSQSNTKQAYLKKSSRTVSLKKQDTVQLPAQTSPGPKRTPSKVLSRTPSLTLGNDEVYVPSASLWPVRSDAPISWSLSSDLSSCPLPWGKLKCLHVNDDGLALGDNQGNVLIFGENGSLKKYVRLGSSLACLTSEEGFLYAACDNGCLYDITFDAPRLLARPFLQNVSHLSLCHGYIAASNETGRLVTLNCFGHTLWSKQSKGLGGWMLCLDAIAVYHGHTGGVTSYHKMSGVIRWNLQHGTPIYHGIQSDNVVYATDGSCVMKINKADGSIERTYKHGHSYNKTGIYAVSVGPGGSLFAAGDKIIGFEGTTGKAMYCLNHPHTVNQCQYHRGQLFCVGEPGVTVINLTPTVLSSAVKGQSLLTQSVSYKKKVAEPKPTLKSVPSLHRKDSKGRTLVQCVKEGDVIKVKPISKGLEKTWSCMFPITLCKEGATFAVDELKPDYNGKFYRIFGRVEEIEDN